MARNENVFMARKKQYGSHPPFPVDNCRRRRSGTPARRPRGVELQYPPAPSPYPRRANSRGSLAAAIMAVATRLGLR